MTCQGCHSRLGTDIKHPCPFAVAFFEDSNTEYCNCCRLCVEECERDREFKDKEEV